MRYLPLTEADRVQMLKVIGAESTEALFAHIPKSIRRKAKPNIPSSKTESELHAYFRALAMKNVNVNRDGWLSFLGAGCYEHFIPAIVDALSSRGEFSTAYTPYQPEISQGTLQAIFEFQSMVAALFGLEVSNASMYDGASSLAEAALMAGRIGEGTALYVSSGVHPDYRAVIQSYLSDSDIRILEVPLDEQGTTKLPVFEKGVLGMIVQQPNFYGMVEPIQTFSDSVHKSGGVMIVGTTEPMAFGFLKSPGEQGADIVAGEGQSFGNPPSFGGPYVGLFATKKEYVRQMPGRLVGKTIDAEGKDGYVLTLATREQHIRREKATSNICTNHSLCALRACIYLAVLGAKGVAEVSARNTWLAHRLHSRLLELKGIEPVFKGHFYNEFAIRLPISSEAYLSALETEKVIGGIPLSKWTKGEDKTVLITVTETKNEDDLDRYVRAVKKAL